VCIFPFKPKVDTHLSKCRQRHLCTAASYSVFDVTLFEERAYALRTSPGFFFKVYLFPNKTCQRPSCWGSKLHEIGANVTVADMPRALICPVLCTCPSPPRWGIDSEQDTTLPAGGPYFTDVVLHGLCAVEQ